MSTCLSGHGVYVAAIEFLQHGLVLGISTPLLGRMPSSWTYCDCWKIKKILYQSTVLLYIYIYYIM